MGMCLNKRVLVGLGVAALGVLAVSPRLFGAVAPLLIVAACPLSMVFMMRAMNRPGEGASCGTTSQDQDKNEVRAGADAAAAVAHRDHDAELRELQEEVNRLKAEMQLRSQEPSA